jgi:hypothetical protein
MYKGFVYKDIDELKLEDYYKRIGERQLKSNKEHIQKQLEAFLIDGKILDGSKIIDSWFPEINADIFISHSHIDNDLALKFAGWLFEKFGLVSFIDSNVWGYSDKLLLSIDDKYSRNVDSKTYNYEKRNISTSHVHMMLSTALTTMIDKTECVIFLETPNSVKPLKDVVKTESPWIYNEILISKVLRLTRPERVKNKVYSSVESFSKAMINEGVKVQYDLIYDHLHLLTSYNLKELLTKFNKDKPKEFYLDELYRILCLS